MFRCDNDGGEMMADGFQHTTQIRQHHEHDDKNNRSLPITNRLGNLGKAVGEPDMAVQHNS